MRLLPRRAALAWGAAVGDAAWCAAPGTRRKALRHLSIAFGKERSGAAIRQLSRASFRALGRNVVDTVQLAARDAPWLRTHVRAEGLEHLERAAARHRGIVVPTGHIGNWELLAAWVAAQGYTVNALGTELYDPRLDHLITRGRRRNGLRTVARGRQTRELIRALRRGEVVGLLMDQDTRVDSVFVEVFGHPAATPVGPALLALRTGAAVVPMTIRREPDHTFTAAIGPEVATDPGAPDLRAEATRVTAVCAQILEAAIRARPQEWVWMHDRWRTEPPRAEVARALAAGG